MLEAIISKLNCIPDEWNQLREILILHPSIQLQEWMAYVTLY